MITEQQIFYGKNGILGRTDKILLNLLNIRDWILWIDNPHLCKIIHASSNNAQSFLIHFQATVKEHTISLEKGDDFSYPNFNGQKKDMLILPIHKDSKLFGALALYHDSPDSFSIKQLEILKDILGQWATFLSQIEPTDLEGSEILPNIHHELRTPLVAILGFSKMLNQEVYGKLNSKQKQYVQNIVNSGEYLLDLVNNFLDIFKIDSNQEELFWETIEIEDICRSAICMVEPRSVEKGLELNFAIEPDVSFCKADAGRLKQILVNLLSNAVKFTNKGSVTLTVQRQGSNILFSIIDTGIGIDPAEMEKLFKPFGQAKGFSRSEEKGTGLGLALSRKLARLHGGEISLISEKGKGSCFTLTMPLNPNKY